MISFVDKKASYSARGKMYFFHEKCFNQLTSRGPSALYLVTTRYDKRKVMINVEATDEQVQKAWDKTKGSLKAHVTAFIPKKYTVTEQLEFITQAIQMLGPLSRKQISVETHIPYTTVCWRVWCNIHPNHEKYGENKKTPMYSIHTKRGYRGVELIVITVK